VASEKFVAAAEAFLSLVDSSDTLPRAQLVRDLERSILDLYVAALALAPGEPDAELEPATRMTDREWRALYERLSDQLAEFDSYSLVFDPFEIGSEPVVGSLADDLADIYRDVAEGLASFRDGDVDEAVWQWRFGFDSHWGQHAAQALPALHALRRNRLG
jgi:Domain of unknown function (DUF5063)